MLGAITLKKVFKKSKLKFIFVDSSREFFLIESENMKAKYFSSREYSKSKRLNLKRGGFFISSILGSKKVEFDIALNLIHGRDGEDGKMVHSLIFLE